MNSVYWLLPRGLLTCSYIEPRTTCPALGPPTAIVNQENAPLPTGASDGSLFSAEVPSPQITWQTSNQPRLELGWFLAALWKKLFNRWFMKSRGWQHSVSRTSHVTLTTTLLNWLAKLVPQRSAKRLAGCVCHGYMERPMSDSWVWEDSCSVVGVTSWVARAMWEWRT